MKVHELAKELKLSSKDLLVRLHELRVDAKGHMSNLPDDEVEVVRETFAEEAATTSGAAVAVATEPEPEPAPATEKEKPGSAAPGEGDPPPEETPRKDAAAEGDRVITIKGSITVKEFAERLTVRPNQLIAELMSMNIFASINQRLELKIAQKVGARHGVQVEHEKKQIDHKPIIRKTDSEEAQEDDRPEDLQPRPPVVTFLGHVDHGKTSLLDRIRSAAVAAGEDGGITQHIGAYTVEHQDHPITFIDTPGHEAFTAMRARGANLTDIAVIVVAADEGLMPQTREAIQHAQAAEVGIMVALNKMDLKTANPDQAKAQLQEIGLTPEDWGGDIICVPVSATTGEGIDQLLEMVLLQAEVLELRANRNRRAEGFVIEARLEPGMGPTATVLIKRGTLNVGDALVCGPYWGKVKALINDQGKKIRSAGPSMAIKILGLTNVPEAGVGLHAYANERATRSVSDSRQQERRLQGLGAPTRKVSLDDLFAQTEATDVKELAILLKTDVQGSLEALQQALGEIKSDRIKIKTLLAGVGNIIGNDVLLASASNAIILGFHVAKEGQANSIAKREGVEIRLYSIIYELLDDVRQAMTGLLDPVLKENLLGHAEILQVFEISKTRRIAGCRVTDGRVASKAKARLLRGEDVMYEGRVASLKRFQDDAAEVREGQECGIRLDQFGDYQVSDVIELYEMESIAQQL